ncbi:MAG: asparagine synthase (glutamine-hydrolyzing) [Thermoleophilaceae bacterium]
MCGIAGIYDRAGGVDADVVRAMTGALVHRGPDGEGHHADGHAALGMRRLAIMDPEHGHQPLFSEDRRIAVVFNGELYNQGELRSWLAERGHRFASGSDGEVIPHLYEELGDRLFERLNGIFAIAIWDSREGTLTIGRDRFGVKPLYVAERSGRLAFASELRALLQDPGVPRELDLEAIDRFLTFRFIPSPGTPFAGIRKLPPATVLTASRDGASERRYWESDRIDLAGASVDELAERYSEAFEQAVVRQMMSDRPIGVMLSGGVDSGAVTAVMSKHSRHVRTFTVGFTEGGDADETRLAEQTAELFGTQHQSLVVPTADYLRRLPESYSMLEEPVGTSSALAVHYVSDMMRPEVPVGLSGQGADELMGGYWRYVGIALAQTFRPLAPAARAAAKLPLGRLGARANRGLTTLGAGADVDLLMRAYRLFGEDAKRGLYRPEILARVAGSDPVEAVERHRRQVADRPLIEQALYVDSRLWLPDELLLIADKMSMAASIELRVPFLDPDLVALAESMPGTVKVRRLRRKYLHKRAMAKWLPREIVYRKERGWSTPMNEWLRGELEPLLRDTLLDTEGLCATLFEPSAMSAMIDDHKSGRADMTRQLFCLLSLGLWHREFLGGDTALAGAAALTA